MSTTFAYDRELADLWSRRSRLTEAEWKHLYALVWNVLYPYRPRELAGLSEDRATLVSEFFEDKVFRMDAAADGKAIHAGALQLFYKNYLIDHLRREARHQEVFMSSDPENGPDCGCGMMEQVADDSEHAIVSALEEAGLPLARLQAVSRDWLGRMEPWVPVYLGMHYCADTEDSEVLIRLAKRMGIASHHHKATHLGFNWAADRAGNSGKSFSDTLLGQFVTRDVGLAITPENSRLILAVFKILCHQALIWVEQMENAS